MTKLEALIQLRDAVRAGTIPVFAVKEADGFREAIDCLDHAVRVSHGSAKTLRDTEFLAILEALIAEAKTDG